MRGGAGRICRLESCGGCCATQLSGLAVIFSIWPNDHNFPKQDGRRPIGKASCSASSPVLPCGKRWRAATWPNFRPFSASFRISRASRNRTPRNSRRRPMDSGGISAPDRPETFAARRNAVLVYFFADRAGIPGCGCVKINRSGRTAGGGENGPPGYGRGGANLHSSHLRVADECRLRACN